LAPPLVVSEKKLWEHGGGTHTGASAKAGMKLELPSPA